MQKEPNYILFYSTKKEEDIISIKSMFPHSKKLDLLWSEKEIHSALSGIEKEFKNNISQIIFFGLETGWDKLIINLKNKYSNIKIKVVCNTLDSLLYYDYERENFFKLLNLSKNNVISTIGFLRKSQYNVYNSLGYKCSYILENYSVDSSQNIDKISNNFINIGIYPLNYTWDKNIFNQLSIGKFIDNSIINYNLLDPRMKDFLNTMKINSNPQKINTQNIVDCIYNNDITVDCSFTNYFHTIFFISLELGIPCIIGNTEDFLPKELKNFLTINSEDNPVVISEKILYALNNKEKINSLYASWKSSYNIKSDESVSSFLNI